MAKNSDRYVVRRRDDWAVTGPGHKRASQLVPTQRQAIERAREIVGGLGGGEVRIQGRNRRWRDSDTIPPGNDPFPPRDRKH